MLSDDQITKFKDVCLEQCGKELSREEAYEKGLKLVRLIEHIYKPIKEGELKILKEHLKETATHVAREGPTTLSST